MKRNDENLEDALCPNYGNWQLTDDGEIVYQGQEIGYEGRIIPVGELSNVHLTHMLGKFRGGQSDDAAQYYFVYLEALRRAGFKKLTIDLDNIHNISIR